MGEMQSSVFLRGLRIEPVEEGNVEESCAALDEKLSSTRHVLVVVDWEEYYITVDTSVKDTTEAELAAVECGFRVLNKQRKMWSVTS